MNIAIETSNLVKRFGRVTAVDGLCLRVAQGEIYAFLTIALVTPVVFVASAGHGYLAPMGRRYYSWPWRKWLPSPAGGSTSRGPYQLCTPAWPEIRTLGWVG
ncbi:MAG: hypothetical protein P8X95_14405 [Anaerolineales bacterium]|jgi:hypothetical protein